MTYGAIALALDLVCQVPVLVIFLLHSRLFRVGVKLAYHDFCHP